MKLSPQLLGNRAAPCPFFYFYLKRRSDIFCDISCPPRCSPAKGQTARPFIPEKWRGRPASIVHRLNRLIAATMTLLSDFISPPSSYHSAFNLFLCSFYQLILFFIHSLIQNFYCPAFHSSVLPTSPSSAASIFVKYPHSLYISSSFITLFLSITSSSSVSSSLWISSPSRCPSDMSSVGWNKYEAGEA